MVVVESRHHGGSRHTVDVAVAVASRSARFPAPSAAQRAEGTNALLAEGAFPVCSAGDVLVALSLPVHRCPQSSRRTPRAARTGRPGGPAFGGVGPPGLRGPLLGSRAPRDLARASRLDLGASCASSGLPGPGSPETSGDGGSGPDGTYRLA